MLFLLIPGVLLAAEPQAEVAAVLDGFHTAAATADEKTYFDLMTEDAVFIGTDATERWPKPAFRTFAEPHFQRDSAWTYTPVERHIQFAPGGTVAWFDERLQHARYGETRGSGVLIKTGDDWKIAQYVLSFPVPNDKARAVVAIIKD